MRKIYHFNTVELQKKCLPKYPTILADFLVRLQYWCHTQAPPAISRWVPFFHSPHKRQITTEIALAERPKQQLWQSHLMLWQSSSHICSYHVLERQMSTLAQWLHFSLMLFQSAIAALNLPACLSCSGPATQATDWWKFCSFRYQPSYWH